MNSLKIIAKHVLILNGEYENKKGKLIFRDKKKDIVNVLLCDELISISLSQDDICAIIE